MAGEIEGEKVINKLPKQKTPEEIQMIIDVWKTTVQVQQHFNTIEMQIRNIAITVLTATIGAAVLVFSESLNPSSNTAVANTPTIPNIPISILKISPAGWILIAGLIAWLSFFMMDRLWYHRFLQASVDHARFLEDELKTDFPYIGLSKQIKHGSPFKLFGREIHSQNRIDFFYALIGLILIGLILIFK